MSRRFAEHPPRRLLRMRPASPRAEHGLALAVPPASRGDEAGRTAETRLLCALAEENALLSRELARVQVRCTQWRNDCIAQAERLEAALMRTRGELMAKETALSVAHDLLAAATVRSAPAAPQAALDARRVLCVGGRPRQIPLYRALVERAGGRLDYIDGAAEPGDLRRALAEADLVILQPAYASQGACRTVEAHCTLNGMRCVRLDKTCVPGFLIGLEQASTPQ